ncbi:MAG: gfo/Idh/MocA family oxidoreductase [Bacteroidetes bacterium]|nr:gfo/Idh/MocA family oxidoreductase [Bacteroidota bacterium]
MVRIGVIGAGHLGNIHLSIILNIPGYRLVGFIDPDHENASLTASRFGIKRYDAIEDLLKDVDAIDIVSPTIHHFDLASMAIKASKHVFIEKPITHTVEQAKVLVELGYEGNVKIQVGHVERFNPAFIQAREFGLKPQYIESRRLQAWNPLQPFQDVVMDMMIHDIDIVLSMVRSNVKSIQATGVHVFGTEPDIANARIEFDNGCVANLTANRISPVEECEIKVYQEEACIRMDFLENRTEIQTPDELIIKDEAASQQLIKTPDNNFQTIPFMRELEHFRESIVSNRPTAVSVQDGYDALNVATQILEKIQSKVNIR